MNLEEVSERQLSSFAFCSYKKNAKTKNSLRRRDLFLYKFTSPHERKSEAGTQEEPWGQDQCRGYKATYLSDNSTSFAKLEF